LEVKCAKDFVAASSGCKIIVEEVDKRIITG
jgi:hypothetical protein